MICPIFVDPDSTGKHTRGPPHTKSYGTNSGQKVSPKYLVCINIRLNALKIRPAISHQDSRTKSDCVARYPYIENKVPHVTIRSSHIQNKISKRSPLPWSSLGMTPIWPNKYFSVTLGDFFRQFFKSLWPPQNSLLPFIFSLTPSHHFFSIFKPTPNHFGLCWGRPPPDRRSKKLKNYDFLIS